MYFFRFLIFTDTENKDLSLEICDKYLARKSILLFFEFLCDAHEACNALCSCFS